MGENANDLEDVIGAGEIVVDHDRLDVLRDISRLVWIRVNDAYNMIWSENPKLHDIGAIVESIGRYGFRTLPVYDKNLTNIRGGLGAIVDGNGRTEALNWMERQGWELPRGVALIENEIELEGEKVIKKEWVMQILVGVDAKSADMARAYAIDANNLTLSGGDMTAYDFLRLWDRNSYLSMLQRLQDSGEPVVSVDADDMAYIMEGIKFDVPDTTQDDEIETDRTYSVKVSIENIALLDEAVIKIRELVDANPDWRASLKV